MPNNDAFYAEDDVTEILKEKCKKRGDKSKIINEAIRHYFKPNLREDDKQLPKAQIIKVIR